MDAEGDRADEHDNTVSEIETDCLAGKGTDHLDFEDTIYEHRNAISKILVEYNLMKQDIEISKPDFIIEPNAGGYVGWFDFNRVEELIHNGETTVQKIIPELKRKLEG